MLKRGRKKNHNFTVSKLNNDETFLINPPPSFCRILLFFLVVISFVSYQSLKTLKLCFVKYFFTTIKGKKKFKIKNKENRKQKSSR